MARVARQGRPARILNLPGCVVRRRSCRISVAANTIFSGHAEFTRSMDFNKQTVRKHAARCCEMSSSMTIAAAPRLDWSKKASCRCSRKPRGRRLGLFAAKGHYDLVYCAGFFDYLPDYVVPKTDVRILYDWVAPGGLVVATNVDSSNPRPQLAWSTIRGLAPGSIAMKCLADDQTRCRRRRQRKTCRGLRGELRRHGREYLFIEIRASPRMPERQSQQTGDMISGRGVPANTNAPCGFAIIKRSVHPGGGVNARLRRAAGYVCLSQHSLETFHGTAAGFVPACWRSSGWLPVQTAPGRKRRQMAAMGVVLTAAAGVSSSR